VYNVCLRAAPLARFGGLAFERLWKEVRLHRYPAIRYAASGRAAGFAAVYLLIALGYPAVDRAASHPTEVDT
jgi:hypothetical protein